MNFSGNGTQTLNDDRETIQPCIMVIFGATGDLTKRKLIPAIYNLKKQNLLPENFAVLGVARSKLTNEVFREKIFEALLKFSKTSLDHEFKEWFCKRLYYLPGDVEQEETFKNLKDKLQQINKTEGTRNNCFFYLASSPKFCSIIVDNLGKAGLVHETDASWRRVIIEKPFGRDLESARSLNSKISTILNENQIYRIDHYLGKETVQNILALRFANCIFEPIWNHRYIDHVQMTVAEDLGVEERGAFYETAGALRDMVPNHIFQLISLIAMEPPNSFDPDAVRDEQAKILKAIQPMTQEEVLKSCVRGQYREGVMKEKEVPGYRTANNVSPESFTETYVALKLFIDNWRWAEVPFYVRTGKRLPKQVTEVAIQFKKAPYMLFRQTPVEHLKANRLVIRIYPDEGVSLSFGAKVPGPVMALGTVYMNFQYKDYFGSSSSTGYERLLSDCMLGDATLFQRADMTESGWNVVQPILDVWKALPPRDFPNYNAGTWGPKEAEALLTEDGRRWNSCDYEKKTITTAPRKK